MASLATATTGNWKLLAGPSRGLSSRSRTFFREFRRSASAKQIVAQAYSKKRGKIPGVSPEYQDAVSRILEQAEKAADSWTIAYTDFLSPPVCAQATKALTSFADVAGYAWGGYLQAERCRIAVGRVQQISLLADSPTDFAGVAALKVSGNFLFDSANHRDFLGAILGTGVAREKVGDILVTGEQGAQVLVAPELVGHFETALTQVRSVHVTTKQISTEDLKITPSTLQEIRSVEASMRLDAIASAGFRMSRGKMVELIKAREVRVNWLSDCKASDELKAGDVISISGKGRLELRSASETKKGKFAIEMVRFM